MSNRPQDPRAANQTADSMLVVIPIFAMLLCVFPVGPIGPPIGFILAIAGLLIGYRRSPSKARSNLLVCSVMALIGTGLFLGIQIVDWIR